MVWRGIETGRKEAGVRGFGFGGLKNGSEEIDKNSVFKKDPGGRSIINTHKGVTEL